MDPRQGESTAIGAVCLVLAAIAILGHTVLVVALFFQRRHSSTPSNSAYAPSGSGIGGNSLYPSGHHRTENSSSRKRNVSSSFFVSLWICHLVHLLIRAVHDVPAIFLQRHPLGSNAAGIVGWMARCSFYSSLLHSMLIVASSYCNRFDSSSTARVQIGCTCLASKTRATLVTLISWLTAVGVATIVKYAVCEYQFDPRIYGYACVRTIHLEGRFEKPAASPMGNVGDRAAAHEETKLLLYIDGTISGVGAVWLIVGTLAVRRQTNRRRRLVEHSRRSALSVNDAAFTGTTTVALQSRGERSRIARARSNRLAAMSIVVIIRCLAHLLTVDSSSSSASVRWHAALAYTVVDFLFAISCPILYMVFTEQLRRAIPGLGGRRSSSSADRDGRQLPLHDVVNRGVHDDDRQSVFSFTPAPAVFSSPVGAAIADRPSSSPSSSMSRVAEKSPFTTSHSAIDNNSPSISSARVRAPVATGGLFAQFAEPRPTPSKSTTTFLSVVDAPQPIKRHRGGPTISADVHRSDIYAISSTHSFGKAPRSPVAHRSPGAARKRSLESFPTSPGDQHPIHRSHSTRPKRRHFQRTSDPQDRSRDDSPSLATGGGVLTDGDSTISDTSSLEFTRAALASMNRTTTSIETHRRRGSLENFEASESLKERSAAARRFVEAYEARNARVQHSLVTAGISKKRAPVTVRPWCPSTTGHSAAIGGLWASCPGGHRAKTMVEEGSWSPSDRCTNPNEDDDGVKTSSSPRDLDQHQSTNDKRCYHDG